MKWLKRKWNRREKKEEGLSKEGMIDMTDEPAFYIPLCQYIPTKKHILDDVNESYAMYPIGEKDRGFR